MIGALLGWGFMKGMYDANIFASAYDVVTPSARGAMSGLMNCTGWMIGGGAAPIAVGLLSRRIGLGAAIAASASAYVLAGGLLLVGLTQFLKRDLAALQAREGRGLPLRDVSATS